MISLDGINDILALDFGLHIKKFGYLGEQEPHM